MKRFRSAFAAVLLLTLSLSAAWPVLAKLHVAPLGLSATATTCDTARKGSYAYTARWHASAPGTIYTLHTGNQCRAGGQVCGTALSTGCQARCDAKGNCSVSLNSCVGTAAAAGQWLKVVGNDGGWQQITAPAPGKCG